MGLDSISEAFGVSVWFSCQTGAITPASKSVLFKFHVDTILYGPLWSIWYGQYDMVCEAILGVSKFISIAWPTRWFDFDAGGTIVPPMSWPSFLNACVTHTVTPQTLCGVFQYLKWFVLKKVTVLSQYHLYHPYIERILHRLEQWDHCIPWYECFHRQPIHSLVHFPRHNIFVDLDHHKDWFHNDQGTCLCYVDTFS